MPHLLSASATSGRRADGLIIAMAATWVPANPRVLRANQAALHALRALRPRCALGVRRLGPP